MDINKFKYEYEYGLLTSCEKIEIKKLNQNLEIWINTEDNLETKISNKQLNVLSDFFDINLKELDKINKELFDYSQELLSEKRILNSSDLYSLDYRALIIPQQNNTKNKCLFLLANTTWKLTDSEFVLEIEIMIKNNKFEFLQEYNGSWMFTMK